MTTAQVLGMILIIFMIGIVYLTTKYVASAECNGNGIYHVMVNAVFRGNSYYRDWLSKNRDYIWCMILIVALCVMILLLIEPFRENRMFIRPESTLYTNIFLWVSIFFTYRWLFKKLGKL